MKRPPTTVTLLYCDQCGRDDRFAPFTGNRHYIGGRPCPGKLRKITYRLAG